MSAIANNPAKYLPSAAYRKAGILVVTDNLFGASPQTAANYGQFFIAPYKCVVLSVDAVWSVASSSGTVDVAKASNGTATASGTSLLTATISTASTADTVNSGTLSTTKSTLELSTGDRLGINDSGTLTSCVDLVVTVVLAPIPSTS